jgi:hypothetical protein
MSMQSNMLKIGLAAIVLGGFIYWWQHAPAKQDSNNLAEDAQEMEQVATDDQTDSCLLDYTVTNINGEFSFKYPCDWNIDHRAEQNSELTSFISVNSPENTYSRFGWPVPDMGLHEFVLTNEFMTTIGTSEYTTKQYEYENNAFRIIEIPLRNTIGYNSMIISYDNDNDKNILESILESITYQIKAE